ncbi:hypothetical protein HDU96_008978 [Phlyctochytrium bullatum]|nr:hypothetical protein HDU96_008978 [Phlyctochytrium bullatum]
MALSFVNYRIGRKTCSRLLLVETEDEWDHASSGKGSIVFKDAGGFGMEVTAMTSNRNGLFVFAGCDGRIVLGSLLKSSDLLAGGWGLRDDAMMSCETAEAQPSSRKRPRTEELPVDDLGTRPKRERKRRSPGACRTIYLHHFDIDARRLHVFMLGGGTTEAYRDNTSYVAELRSADSSPAVIAWRGTVNPNDIAVHGHVAAANFNCTVEQGLYQDLAVIVKRSTNKDLIQREIDFLDRASKGEFIVAFAGWFEEVELGVMGLVMQKCAMDLKDWSKAAVGSPPADLDDKMLRISEAIAKGLAFIKNQDIIHNDLKPHNFLVD